MQFPKPIIAGVNGNAMGLGVTMLPLFDMVIANDKAEFCLPYAKLGQVPEGGATYTFPNLCGKLQVCTDGILSSSKLKAPFIYTYFRDFTDSLIFLVGRGPWLFSCLK